MSTRSTIIEVYPLHIYKECIDKEICITLEHPILQEEFDRKRNEKYRDVVWTIDDLFKLREQLTEYLDSV